MTFYNLGVYEARIELIPDVRQGLKFYFTFIYRNKWSVVFSNPTYVFFFFLSFYLYF